MSSVSASLVRRAAGLAHVSLADHQESSDGTKFPLSPAQVFVLVGTCIGFFCLIFSLEYTYGYVVGVLAMVESTATNSTNVLNNDKTTNKSIEFSKEPSLATDATDSLLESDVKSSLPHKPITSNLRGTIAHLRLHAGRWSRFRGLALFFCWAMARGMIVGSVTSISHTRNPAVSVAAVVLAEILLARWELTWYHIVISTPSPQPWWRRVPSFKSRVWTKIAPAVALRSITTQVVTIFPILVCQSLGTMKHLHDPSFEPSKQVTHLLVAQLALVPVLAVALFVLLQVPATVTVVRVAASMLPEGVDTIVPFDRTFGGKMIPTGSTGGSRIGLIDAWKTFTKTSRVRLLKLAFKVLAIVLATWVLFLLVLGAELRMFGKATVVDLAKWLKP